MDAGGQVRLCVPFLSVTAVVQALFVSHLETLRRIPGTFCSDPRGPLSPGQGDFSKVSVPPRPCPAGSSTAPCPPIKSRLPANLGVSMCSASSLSLAPISQPPFSALCPAPLVMFSQLFRTEASVLPLALLSLSLPRLVEQSLIPCPQKCPGWAAGVAWRTGWGGQRSPYIVFVIA